MKLKVSLFNSKLLKQFLEFLSLLSLLCSFVLIFWEVPDNHKVCCAICLFALLVIIYLYKWCRANRIEKLSLKINNSTLDVKIGDIFNEEGLKVIAFNEYFDTQVDDRIIARTSLNGKYIASQVADINDLDSLIKSNVDLNRKVIETNHNRTCGKRTMYKLGTIFLHNDFLLTAFSKFDEENRAHLKMQDYVDFLLNFWNEIDIIYAGRSVSIPLLGAGITRFKDYDCTEQELLELIIWSFKVSRVKFTYPSKVTIIIHESIKDKINLYKLKI